MRWRLIRPGNPPIGEPLEGPLPAFPRAGGRLLADVSAEVGGQRYFAPLITNASASDITLEVNPATAAAVRCNCLVSKGAVRTHIGYYRLYQNTSVAAYNSAHPYIGPHADRHALDPRLLMRARGALPGLVVGNQLGAPTEPLGTATAIREAFPQGVRDLAPPPKGSPFDDDAAMTLLLAESLAEKGDFDAHDVAERWVKWMKRDGRGIGLTTQRALRLIERGTEPFEAGRLAHNARAASNGAVMRCIPVALRYHDNVDRLIRVSAQQAAITHADERCTWGAVAVNLAARELLHGNQHFVEEVLHRLQGAPRPLIEAIQRVPWEQESDLPIGVSGEAGYVVHCVEIAFWCGMHRPSLEEALIFLAEAGGDTDTNAAVAGALLGAREGEAAIPPRWLEQLGHARGVSALAERLIQAASPKP